MTSLLGGKTFEYGSARIKDLVAEQAPAKTDGLKKSRRLSAVGSVGAMNLDGRRMAPTKRFWTSLQCRFGFSSNIFRYFSHDEVFNRISKVAPDDVIRYCVEKDVVTGNERLLAVTNPTSSCVKVDKLSELLAQYDAKTTTYLDGIVRSSHQPRMGANPFQVAGDDFVNQFVIDTPIDGFGKPNIYLSMMRLICSNGAIGYSPAFRSEINTGSKDDDVTFSLMRAMDSYNNEDGFAAMRSRLDAAGNSWASVKETQKLYGTLMRCQQADGLIKKGKETVQTSGGAEVVETSLPILRDFHRMVGDLPSTYGLSNMDNISAKSQSRLPTKCKVYDLINFCSETATHHAKPVGAKFLQSFIGDIISDDFDLEGTCDKFSDWNDFFIGNKEAIEAKEAVRRRPSR
jgi:hypothetical protein